MPDKFVNIFLFRLILHKNITTVITFFKSPPISSTFNFDRKGANFINDIIFFSIDFKTDPEYKYYWTKQKLKSDLVRSKLIYQNVLRNVRILKTKIGLRTTYEYSLFDITYQLTMIKNLFMYVDYKYIRIHMNTYICTFIWFRDLQI